MKITKKLYSKMLKCCLLVDNLKDIEKEIEKELIDKYKIDIEELRDKDGALVDFINYGISISKERIEEDLNDYLKEK